jgi:hypothetical protein
MSGNISKTKAVARLENYASVAISLGKLFKRWANEEKNAASNLAAEYEAESKLLYEQAAELISAANHLKAAL